MYKSIIETFRFMKTFWHESAFTNYLLKLSQLYKDISQVELIFSNFFKNLSCFPKFSILYDENIYLPFILYNGIVFMFMFIG